MRRYTLNVCNGVFPLKKLNLLFFISTLAAVFSLAGCGVKGDLVHPDEQNQAESENSQGASQTDSDNTPLDPEKETT